MDFVQMTEVINVQMNDTIFILSTKHIYVQSFMWKLLVVGELEVVIIRRKIMSKNNGLR
jgi:hypothetical protein